MNTPKKIDDMKSMMQSMFAYHQLQRSGYFFDMYLKAYEEELGTELFDKVYNEHSEYLKGKYEVVSNVYTDHEGCTYNELKEK